LEHEIIIKTKNKIMGIWSKNNFSKFFKRNFVFCDVGARWGIEEPWKSQRNLINVVSFEPDKVEYEKIKKEKRKQDVVLPYALCNEKKTIDLNLTKSRGCSSIFEPNFPFLEKFPNVERFAIEEKEAVDSTTLDNLYETNILKNVDFIKLDTQGSELDILKGGEALIYNNIIGIQVEVEFKPMYKSQPLFNDVDIFIRNKFGLELFDIRKTYWKYKEGRGIGPSKGQLIFGDALYFRCPFELPRWCSQFGNEEGRNKIIMACFMGVLYGYPDYSLCLLERTETGLYLNTETINKLKQFIILNVKKNKFFKGVGKLSGLMLLLSEYLRPDHEGWGSSESHLGSRKLFGIFY